MKIVAITMLKGGTGKTTFAVHTTHFLGGKGHKTLLVDVDRQANASRSFVQEVSPRGASLLYTKGGARKVEVQPADDVENVFVIAADPGLRAVREDQVPLFVENLRAIAKREKFDYVVLDTPPTPHDDMAAPLDVADFVFAPIVPDVYGLGNAHDLNERIQEARERRGDGLTFLGFVPTRYNARIKGHREVLDAMKSAFDDELSPIVVNERAAYVNASFEGKPVWEVLDENRNLGGATRVAAKEMRGALNWLYKKMEATNG